MWLSCCFEDLTNQVACKFSHEGVVPGPGQLHNIKMIVDQCYTSKLILYPIKKIYKEENLNQLNKKVTIIKAFTLKQVTIAICDQVNLQNKQQYAPSKGYIMYNKYSPDSTFSQTISADSSMYCAPQYRHHTVHIVDDNPSSLRCILWMTICSVYSVHCGQQSVQSRVDIVDDNMD